MIQSRFNPSTEPSCSPQDVDALAAALGESRKRESPLPVLQWVVDHSREGMENILGQLAFLTCGSVPDGDRDARLKIKKLLYRHIGQEVPEQPKFHFKRIHRYSGSFVTEHPFGGLAHVFIPREYAEANGIPLEDVMGIVSQHKLHPLKDGVYPFFPVSTALAEHCIRLHQEGKISHKK